MGKAAIIIESSGKAVELKESAGLFECLLEHELKSTKADFNWKGKTIPAEVWHEVLAFFKWTQYTDKSESQVRLFVHPEHGWMAWAFPQKGGTGMTTKEIESEDSKNQRALNIPEGYVPFGTVHHHCTASAFQSSVDTADENNVDGLHMTVGHLDKPKYDLNCRLYIKGHKFEPDMSAFWDIGEDARNKIKFVGDLGFSPSQIMDKVARLQMCEKPDDATPFNEIWKQNYIVEPAIPPGNYYGCHYGGLAPKAGSWCRHCLEWVTDHNDADCKKKGSKGSGKPIGGGSIGRNGNVHKTATQALETIETDCTLMGLTDSDLGLLLQEMGQGELAEVYSAIFEECAEQLLTPGRLWNAYQNRENKRSKEVRTARTSGQRRSEPPEQQAHEEAIEEWQRQQAEGGWGGC